MYGEQTTLTRSVEAIQIPYGQKTPLEAGSRVSVHQVLGGNFTVVTDNGMMVRIDAKDADALGEIGRKASAEQKTSSFSPDPAIPIGLPADQAGIVKQVWDLLRTVYDPEIPVNIVELGLIYEMDIKVAPEGGYRIDIKMSLTAPGCGMGPVLQQDVQTKVSGIPGVKSVGVEVVFEPAWDPSRMTEAARLQLGML